MPCSREKGTCVESVVPARLNRFAPDGTRLLVVMKRHEATSSLLVLSYIDDIARDVRNDSLVLILRSLPTSLYTRFIQRIASSRGGLHLENLHDYASSSRNPPAPDHSPPAGFLSQGPLLDSGEERQVGKAKPLQFINRHLLANQPAVLVVPVPVQPGRLDTCQPEL